MRETTRGGLPILVGAAIFLAGLIGHPINHDTAWFLAATRKWLSGAELYVDLIEVNPPLQFYLTLPAVWLADASGLADATAQYLVLASLMTASLFWCWRMLIDLSGLAPMTRVILLAGLTAVLIIVPMGNEAQREHFMVLFVLPYALGWFLLERPDRGRDGIARAAFAAVGLCIKPYFVIFPLVLTAVAILRARSLRPVFSPANMTMLAVGLLYLLLVALRHPAYLTEIVPLGTEVYGAYHLTTKQFLLGPRPVPAALFLALCWLAFRRGVRGVDAAVALLFAAMVIYALQFSGFPYHALPIGVVLGLGVLWIVTQPDIGRWTGVLGVAVAVLVVWQPLRDGRYAAFWTYAPRVPVLGPMIENSGTPASVLVLSDGLTTGQPLVSVFGGTWVSSYPVLWPVPGALERLHETDCTELPEDCARFEKVLADVRDRTLKDLRTGQPDIVLFETMTQFIRTPDFDFYGFMSEAPEFRAEMENYEFVDFVTGVAVYRRM